MVLVSNYIKGHNERVKNSNHDTKDNDEKSYPTSSVGSTRAEDGKKAIARDKGSAALVVDSVATTSKKDWDKMKRHMGSQPKQKAKFSSNNSNETARHAEKSKPKATIAYGTYKK